MPDIPAPSLAGRTAVVVGGAGFVGSNLVRALALGGATRTTVVDNLLSSERSSVPTSPAVHFLEGSIADDEVLRQLPTDSDYIFHLATYHGNQNSIADPLADHQNNTLTTLKLLDQLVRWPRPAKIIYSSAGCTVAPKTFDVATPTSEDDPVSLWLDSPYQISKIVGELYGNFYFHHHGIPFVKARFQNVYGPGEILGAGVWRGTAATVWRNVTPTFVYRALQRQALPVENGGVATRDFIYVDDIVDGLMRCAVLGEPGETYNLASGVETSILDLATTINELTGNPAGLHLRPARDWDRSGKRFGSTDKAIRHLGFHAQTALRDGLSRTVTWTREHLATVDACIARHQSMLPDSEAASA